MDPEEARRALGIGSGATPAELRRAWRRLVREAHPDVAPGGTDAGERTARINAAYTLLRSGRRPSVGTPAPAPGPHPAPPPAPVRADSGTLVFAGPPTPTYLGLLEAAHRIGDVTHIDLDGGLLEILVDGPGVGTCSVLVDVEGRPDGGTEASVSIEILNDPLRTPEPALLRSVLDGLAARS